MLSREAGMRTLMVALCLGAGIAVAAQEPAQFEVASVKRNTSGGGNSMLRRLPGGRMTATNMPVRPMITFAYNLASYQLVGGPSWISVDSFDIVAKMDGDPAPAVPGSNTPDPMQLALRNLLEDRFKLKVHRETREMDIYALVMAKPGGAPGPTLKPAGTDCAAQAAAARRGAQPALPGPPGSGGPFCGIFGGPGRLRFGGLPSASFAQAFSGPSGRMVVDRTGLSGAWDFELTYTPEGRGGPGPATDAPAADANAPSFFTAVQEQLGLKLESTKGPVEVLVVDSIEKPVED
jgi:bla regulator protein blaR1